MISSCSDGGVFRWRDGEAAPEEKQENEGDVVQRHGTGGARAGEQEHFRWAHGGRFVPSCDSAVLQVTSQAARQATCNARLHSCQHQQHLDPAPTSRVLPICRSTARQSCHQSSVSLPSGCTLPGADTCKSATRGSLGYRSEGRVPCPFASLNYANLAPRFAGLPTLVEAGRRSPSSVIRRPSVPWPCLANIAILRSRCSTE